MIQDRPALSPGRTGMRCSTCGSENPVGEKFLGEPKEFIRTGAASMATLISSTASLFGVVDKCHQPPRTHSRLGPSFKSGAVRGRNRRRIVRPHNRSGLLYWRFETMA